jgi:HAD superfamily hydrolase (TIGR01509 family)
MGVVSRHQVQAVFLDLDDTLINMKRASHLAFNDTLTRHGLRPVSYREMLANWDTSWRVVVTNLAPADTDVDKLMTEIGREYFEKFFKIHLKHSILLPGAVKTLQALRVMKLLTAIVSRRRRRVISEELDKFKLRPYIDTIVGREDVTQVKPAPNALTLAAERLAVPIDQCLMVGDSPNDVKAGKAAGAKTAAVLTGPYPVETIVLENPDVVVDSIADLVTVLDRTFDWVTLSDRME